MNSWYFVLGLVIALIGGILCLACVYVNVEPPRPEPTILTTVDEKEIEQ